MAAHGPRLWLDQIDPDRKGTRGGGRVNDEEFHLLDEIEESHWWFVGKRILLRSLLADIAPGGRMVVAVPAFQLLWSRHDVTFEHHRRYSASQLVDVVRRAGLEPERTTCTNFILFPIAALWRILSHRLGVGRFAPKHDFWPVPSWLNAVLAGLYRLEAWWLRRADVPFGVSVLCIARRP